MIKTSIKNHCQEIILNIDNMHHSAELHERCTQIDKLRKRYEILMTTMAPPEGEEEHSAAYYVIAAAQVCT